MVPVDFHFNGQLPDGVRLHRLYKTDVFSQFQRWKRIELCPRPEALGLIHSQQLKIRVSHRRYPILLHDPLIQRRKASQNGTVHGLGQLAFFVSRRGRLRPDRSNGSCKFLCIRRKNDPAVARFRHAEMFQSHNVHLLLLPCDRHGQHQQNRTQHCIQDLGVQSGAVPFHIHFRGVLRVIIKRHRIPHRKAFVL